VTPSPVISNDPVAVASGGMERTANPTAPTLTVTAGTNSAVATIAGDSGATHYLYYKSASQKNWQDGGSREGDGTITITGLSNDVAYIFVAYSKNAPGLISLPSMAVVLTFAAAVENEFDQLLIDMTNDFLAEFGEPISYLPAGGGEREITAIVDREPPAELEGMPGSHSPRLVISVANNSTDGISSSEINISKDKVELSVRINETAQERLITKIISQDAGMMSLEVR